jgi:hypothetical protein
LKMMMMIIMLMLLRINMEVKIHNQMKHIKEINIWEVVERNKEEEEIIEIKGKLVIVKEIMILLIIHLTIEINQTMTVIIREIIINTEIMTRIMYWKIMFKV